MSGNKHIPPKLANRFLKWFLRDDLAEEVQGDLEEQLSNMLKGRSVFRAKLAYWYQVINYLRPFAIQKFHFNQINHHIMLKNYVKVGWRHMHKSKWHAYINVGGLAVGMSVAMLIGFWVWDELSFNKNHANYDRIAQVMRSGSLNGETFTFPYLPFNLFDELKNEYASSFNHIVVASLPGEHILSHGENKLFRRGNYVDKGGPEMLSLNMIQGSRSGLNDMHGILISSSTANALFGRNVALGKRLTIDNDQDVQVTGVYEDLPLNSSFEGIDFFASGELYVACNPWIHNLGFKNNFLNIFVEIRQETSFTEASARIEDAIFNNIQDDAEMVKIHPRIHLYPMSKWHLYDRWENGVSVGGQLKFVWLFGLVGIFVLLLACINFMNLNTARSEKRSKEIGIRKTIGSMRRQLIAQFLSESFLMVLLAFSTSILLVTLSLGLFNEVAGKQIEVPFTNPSFWLICLSIVFVTSIVAGSYPAVYLSSFNPLRALKGGVNSGGNVALPRKVLVVIQFSFSVMLIIGTIVVFQQIRFVKNRPVGYERDNLLMVRMTTDEFYAKYDAISTALKTSGAVMEVSQSLSPVTGVWSSNGGYSWRGMDPGWQQEDFASLSVTASYGKTVGWQFIMGRDFNEELASDSTGFVISESAAKIMGFENPIGEVVHWNFTDKNYTIIGVIKDMIMQSPFSTPMPAIFYRGGRLNWINIKIKPQTDTKEALTEIESVFRELIPTVPFAYEFADQEYALKFQAEERIGKLSGVFTLLAIFISCLGLFGLSSYMAEQRTKEVGIRKVLGASTANLWRLLSQDFVVLVLISSIIACPVMLYMMKGWLQSYEYRISIGWWVFVVACVGSVLITIMTVSFQTIKAALMNPVNSLRSE